jgi:two-component system chemotaxis response regulator CheB
MSRYKPITVLIVDDSAMIRKVLSMGFEGDTRLKIVGTAHSVEQARSMIDALCPDVVTLDIEMPKVDGLTFLAEIMARRPMPVVIISSLAHESTELTMRAMELGAVDVIAKPALGIDRGLTAIMETIRTRVAQASQARVVGRTSSAITQPSVQPVQTRLAWPKRPGQKIIAIGASTGGVQALARILPMLPANSPGVLVVQHMPDGFTAAFAKRLNTLCSVDVREACDGDLVQDGLVLLAPGGQRHMQLRRAGFLYRVALTEGRHVCFSRPSVDVLFQSVAETAGPNASAAILTGMGRDGSAGLLAIRTAGGFTLAQDGESSVVNGMPAAAIEIGAAWDVVTLDDIPKRLLNPATGVAPAPTWDAPPDQDALNIRSHRDHRG